MPERAFVEVRSLTKSYGSKVAVAPLDLQVGAGEFMSLLGPSGSGKTTVLRMLAGLVRPDGGSIRIADAVVADGRRSLPPEQRGVGMVFQDLALWPHMNVSRNIAFGLRLRGMRKRDVNDRVEEMLRLVNLPGLGTRFPHQLSGGQQQRVALARALATTPKLLLLDEPLSALDTGLRESMREELIRIVRATGTTVINVTHDQDEAMVLSDRIAVLRDGRLQQEGTPADLYWRPRTAFVGRFMGPANVMEGKLVKAHGGFATLAHGGLEFTGRLGEGTRLDNGALAVLCRAEHVTVRPATDPGAGRLPATVTGSWFAGGRWRVRVKVGDIELTAVSDTEPPVEAKLSVGLPPELCWVVES